MEVFLTSFATWSEDLGRIESHLFTSLISNLENSIKVSKLFITLRIFFSIVNIPCKGIVHTPSWEEAPGIQTGCCKRECEVIFHQASNFFFVSKHELLLVLVCY